jgi:hypothetical protein
MTDQEIKAKALECSIAAFQALPEESKKIVIKDAEKKGANVYQHIVISADIFLAYIKR